MNTLARWILGGLWGIWLTLPAIALARSASDLLTLYGTCRALAGAGVGLLWVAMLGLRHLSSAGRAGFGRDRRAPQGHGEARSRGIG